MSFGCIRCMSISSQPVSVTGVVRTKSPNPQRVPLLFLKQVTVSLQFQLVFRLLQANGLTLLTLIGQRAMNAAFLPILIR